MRLVVFGSHNLIFDLLSLHFVKTLEVVVIDQSTSFLEYLASIYDVYTVNADILEVESLCAYLDSSRDTVFFALSKDDNLNIVSSMLIRNRFSIRSSVVLLQRIHYNLDADFLSSQLKIDYAFTTNEFLNVSVLPEISYAQRLRHVHSFKSVESFIPMNVLLLKNEVDLSRLHFDKDTTVLRNHEILELPDVLYSGDIIISYNLKKRDLTFLMSLACREVCIVGYNDFTDLLIKELLKRNIDVEIIVNDKDIAVRLARLFDIHIVYHRIISQRVFVDVKAGKNVLLLFLSPDIEDNIVYSLLFQERGYNRGIVIMERVTNFDVSSILPGFKVINTNQLIIENLFQQISCYDIEECFVESMMHGDICVFLLFYYDVSVVKAVYRYWHELQVIYVQRNRSVFRFNENITCVKGDFIFCYMPKNKFEEFNRYIRLIRTM
ncbi:MAG: hypothetical protein P857_393 [Candidatus Xenolissoclinum pacificiensis L6]|uniref:RCK N-terminal domain-containing protein n=1 Tax=Candidatus Xenolissoclinum pacificiensis L6 TaxID=1401685 RepID=W2UZ92_9RICK|nr:MAG: hypothetical protein P857_393 [Candidatus Xenolissoclinum pacificiensis L6]